MNRRRPFQIKLAKTERLKLDLAAKAKHLPLSTWIRKVALEAAERQQKARG